MTMSEHTKPPYEVVHPGREGGWPGIDETRKDGITLVLFGNADEDCGIHGNTPEQALATAEFIVTACNAHEGLVAALKGILDCHVYKDGEWMRPLDKNYYKTIQAALTKANDVLTALRPAPEIEKAK